MYYSHHLCVSDDISKAVFAGEEYCVDISAQAYKVLSFSEKTGESYYMAAVLCHCQKKRAERKYWRPEMR